MDTSNEEFSSDHSDIVCFGTAADFAILIEGNVIKVKKSFLALHNLYFGALFGSNMLEASANDMNINEDFDAFKAFLQYLHTGHVDEHTKTIDLLIVADKYLDWNLKELCEQKLCQDITTENAAERLLESVLYSCSSLKEIASQFIADNIAEVRNSPDFHRLFENADSAEIIFRKTMISVEVKMARLLTKKSQEFTVTVPAVLSDYRRKFKPYIVTLKFDDMTWELVMQRFGGSADPRAMFMLSCSSSTKPQKISNIGVDAKIICSTKKPLTIMKKIHTSCDLRNPVHDCQTIALSELRRYVNEEGLINVMVTLDREAGNWPFMFDTWRF